MGHDREPDRDPELIALAIVLSGVLPMRWLHEHDFDTLVESAAIAHALDMDLVKGLIAQESQFDPNAVGDDGKSLGLMQVQEPTAVDVGVTGDLFDPLTNIAAGTKYLAEQIARAGSVDGGISAYNGGYRPALGFGAPLPSGSFRNQAYVDGVKEKWAYFRRQRPQPSSGPVVAGDAPPGSGLTAIALAVGIGSLIALLLVYR